MKVLFFATHAIQYHVPIYRELSRMVDLEVIFMMKQSPKGQSDSGFGVEFEWDLPMHDGYRYKYMENHASRPGSATFEGIVLSDKELAELILQKEPKVVCVHGWFPKGNRQVIDLSYKLGIPLICRGDSNLVMNLYTLKNWVKKIYLKPVLKKISYFLEVGKRNHEFYDFMGVPRSSRSYALHCIDTPLFVNAFNACTKDNRPKIQIGFCGKLIEKKRPLDLLKAIARSSKRDRIKVVVIGDGPLRKSMEAYAREHEIGIEFFGFLNQSEIVRKGYCHLDLLVMCSDRKETWGLVANEAMSGGIPVILSDRVGATPDLIDEGQTGFSYPAGNIKILGDKINQFIDMRNRGADFGDAVLRKIQTYSLDLTIQSFLQAFHRFN